MNITINTKYKTITLEESMNIEQFINEIGDILPDWKSYTLIPKYNQYPNWPTIWPYSFWTDTTTPKFPITPIYNPPTVSNPLSNPSTLGPGIVTNSPGLMSTTTNANGIR